MSKNERGSSDVIFILVFVLLAILVIIAWTNISQGTPFGERLLLKIGTMWSGIVSFFKAVIARF